MKNIFPLLILILVTGGSAFSQAKKPHPALNDLMVKWEIIENNHKNIPQSLSAFTLSTRNKFQLPAKGWKIYFSFPELITPGSATGDVNITHINGDLFCIAPSANFKGIKPGASLRIEFVSGVWVINFTDAPQGLYLIWENAPDKYYAIGNITVVPSARSKQYLRSPADKIDLTTPQLTYGQNKSVRNIPADSLIKVFPTPVAYKQTADKFYLDGNTVVLPDHAFHSEARLLRQELHQLILPAKRSIVLQAISLVQKPMADDAYELSITNTGITISASTNAGIFYGIQSFKSMLPAGAWHQPQKLIVLPGVMVSDQPRFSYRALALDVARNFQTKKEILKVIDLMALYKMNILHFHLTDDEGWRIEIPGLPELTEVGAKRGQSTNEQHNLWPALGSGPFVDNSSGSGFYSKADFVEMLKYATQRHVTIIPEIESPGHARAAVKAMDARYKNLMAKALPQQASQYLLHDLKDSSKYQSVQYYHDNVVNVALPSTYTFIEKVTDELQKMYAEAGAPLKTIHYGGDEVPNGVWEKSPAVLSLMKADPSIKNIDDLWPYYYQRMNQILKSHQLYLTAWEEVGTRKVVQDGKKVTVINPDLAHENIHLEVWNNVLGWGSEDLAYKLANSGYKVILSCVTNLYFDMAYNKSFDEPGYYWGGYADVDRSFRFIPFDYFKNSTADRMGNPLSPSVFAGKDHPTEAGKANIIGLQGALWSETIKGPDRLEYMLLPKLLGLAERAWATDPQWAIEPDTTKSRILYDEAWSHFVNILGKRELPRLDYYAGGYQYRIPVVGVMETTNGLLVNHQFPGFSIRYTLDGTMPTLNGAAYRGVIKNKGVIKLRVFNQAGRGGKVVEVVR